MKRVQEDGDWTLMCPAECPGLSDVHGAEFEALYAKYENEMKGECALSTLLTFRQEDH